MSRVSASACKTRVHRVAALGTAPAPVGASLATPSAAEVDRGDLAALVAQLPTDHQPHGPILRLLRARQHRAGGTADGGGQPPGQFLVTRLGIGMAQAMQLV